MGDEDQKENNAGKKAASEIKGFFGVVVTIVRRVFIFHLSFEMMKVL